MSMAAMCTLTGRYFRVRIFPVRIHGPTAERAAFVFQTGYSGLIVFLPMFCPSGTGFVGWKAWLIVDSSFSEGAGGGFFGFAKNFGQVVAVGETALFGNGVYACICVEQQVAGFVYPDLC